VTTARVRERLEVLAHLEEKVLDLHRQVLQAQGGAVYGVDLLANAATNRSLALASGFRVMVEARNLICAGALLRLQIDTASRFFASSLVDDPESFAESVLAGDHIDKIPDRDGEPMRDRYLVKKLAAQMRCEWLPRVYRETSGYVHFSDKHVHSTFTEVRGDHTAGIKVGAVDKEWPEETYLEAVDAFIAAVQLYGDLLRDWGLNKANPEIVRELRQRRAKDRG
jgi:hypothetical protein